VTSTLPALPAWGWSRLAIGILALGVTAQGQISITASRQDPAVPRAYVGADIPKSLAIYLTTACNQGDAPITFYRDRIAAEIAKLAPLQDGEAILYAARVKKSSGKRVALLSIGTMLVPVVGSALAAAMAGSALTTGAAAAGGIPGIVSMLSGRREQLTRLDVPENWWTADPTRLVALQSGQCMEPMMLALGQPADANMHVLLQQAAVIPASISSAGDDGIWILPVVKQHLTTERTHPILDEDLERAEQIAAWVRERTAAQGAQQ